MSHFTVLVVGDNVEEQLAPYQENNMGDCPREYMEFNDVTEEMEKSWAKEEEKDKYDNDFDKWVTEYHGYHKDELIGKYGYWHNPNSKWDWYQIGGRWTGFFKLKGATLDGTPENTLYPDHTVGTPGILTEAAKKGYADSVRKCDIDFEGMKKEAGDSANEEYTKFEEATKGIEIPEKWDDFRKKFENIEDARKAWHDLPFRKALYDAQIYSFGDVHETFCIGTGGRKAYIERAVANAFSTFAVLMDGKWYERGSMGWWGMVSNENDDWHTEFMKLFDSVPGDTLFTVVDCHI